MGITIHYRMVADDLKTVVAALKIVKEEAQRAGYEYKEFEDEGVATMDTLPVVGDRDSMIEWLNEAWGGYREEVLSEVPDEPPFAWIHGGRCGIPFFWHKEVAERCGIQGKPVKGHGVIVYCDTAEPFKIFFWKLGNYYISSNFTKTQPFTAEEVQPNLRYHKWICMVLKRVEKLPWWRFYVGDESGYYDSMDEEKLRESFEATSKIIWAVSSAIQEAIDKAGLPWRGVVGGRHDIKEMRDKLRRYGGQTRVENHDDRQTRLDDFDGGGPHRLWTHPSTTSSHVATTGLIPSWGCVHGRGGLG